MIFDILFFTGTVFGDQWYRFGVALKIMDHQSDSEIVKPLAERFATLFPIKSWSFNKGFWHKDNKAFLAAVYFRVITFFHLNNTSFFVATGLLSISNL